MTIQAIGPIQWGLRKHYDFRLCTSYNALVYFITNPGPNERPWLDRLSVAHCAEAAEDVIAEQI